MRGPKTRKTLKQIGFDCPECYGDPGVLMPLLYQPKIVKSTDYLIIPHFSVEKEARREYGEDHIASMNTKDYQGVIDRICATNKVISSSLHGVILAEAYGVPAVFYRDRQERFNYKYIDWYEGTGRPGIEPACSIEHGIEICYEQPEKKIIKQMQKILIDTFPSELWES